MLKVKIEWRNVGCERVARFLTGLKKPFPLGYKVWLQDNRVFACFMLESIDDLNDLVRKLKRMKNTFKFHQIMKVHICRTKG